MELGAPLCSFLLSRISSSLSGWLWAQTLSPYSTNNKGSIHGLVAVQWPVLTLRQKRHSEPGIHLILCPSSKCCCFSNFFLLLGTLQWLHIVVGFIFCPEFIAAKCDGADMSYLTIIRSRIFPLYLCIWREHRWF